MTTSSRIGQGLAFAMGIKLDSPEHERDRVTRGESLMSVDSSESFVEEAPTTVEYLSEFIPTGKQVVGYLASLFPFTDWILFYNLQWLIGDLVAGITIGAVVVPQGMAYAKLANLPVEFGLYSSFMGVLIYWFFATSKDITIGPVAVMSQVTGNVVFNVIAKLPQYKDTPWIPASALAIIAGAIVLLIGLIRAGWLVELIPLVSLAAFMTGSALNIAAGQIPTMLGTSTYFSTRDATYMVIINTLKYLPKCNLDAAMGLTALFLLYLIRGTCSYLARRYPSRQKLYFFLSTLRTAFVILLYTLISWLVNMWHNTKPSFSILRDVPRGFQHAAVPVINTELISAFVGDLPSSVIVLLIEHIAISKSFGRVNNYRINPSQEMVAIGVTNLLGPFLGGYPSTGSFSRTAIKSKAGVRTPFAGVITAVVVLLAIYALPAVFYYIPQASLAAVIIHAVGDLITPPNTLYRFWRVSPLEVLIFFAGVLVTVFTTIENGIYTTICVSFFFYIVRAILTRGRFLGRVTVRSVLGDNIFGHEHSASGAGYGAIDSVDASLSPAARNVFLPVNHGDGSNPKLDLENPYPGIFIYRFTEGFNYPNANHTLEYLVSYVLEHTRRTQANIYKRPGDRPWNDPGPKKGQREFDEEKPTLKAIILDFSSINTVDATSMQQLIDVRNQLDRYASPDPVDWHIACISSRWTKRALVASGFGYPSERGDGLPQRWRSIFSVAEIGGIHSAAAAAEKDANEKEFSVQQTRSRTAAATSASDDIAEVGGEGSSVSGSIKKDDHKLGGGGRGLVKRVPVHGLNRPLFHVDLTSALQSAITNVEARAEYARQEPAAGV